MKIGINGRFLLKPYTGIGRYTRNLLSEMAKQFSETLFVVVVPGKMPTDNIFSAELDDAKNIKIKVLEEKMWGSAGIKKTYWEQVQVPAFFAKENVDLMHFPYPCNPWIRKKIPTVVTVHDTIPWVMPEYRKSFLTRLYQDRCKNAVKRADKIITVSESSKNDICETCKVKPEKIRVIHNAVKESFKIRLTPEERSERIAKYGITPDKPFILYTGGFDSRKNVKMVVDVFIEKIAPEYDVDLVLAGGKSLETALYDSFDDLTKLQNNTSFKSNKGKIVATGFIEETDLPALYQSAFAFINLSKKEGFNLPLLEALISRIPVIVSNLPVHHEVAGENAIFCKCDDRNCVIYHLKKLIDDTAYYQKQKQKAESAEFEFSWETSAKETMQIYKSAI